MGNRLYVGNLSFQANSDTVRAAFSQFGESHRRSRRLGSRDRPVARLRLRDDGHPGGRQKAIAEMNGAHPRRPRRSRSTRPKSARTAAAAAVVAAAVGGGGGGGRPWRRRRRPSRSLLRFAD